MGGDLEHRVGRRVEDQFPGLHMPGPQVLDDFGAGCGVVAEEPVSGFLFDSLDQRLRESLLRERGVGSLRHDSCDLPVARCGILACAGFGQTPKAHRRPGSRGNAQQTAVQIAQSRALEVG